MLGSSRSFGSSSLQLWDTSTAVLILASSELSHSLPASQLLTCEGRDKSSTCAAIAARDVQTAWCGTKAGIVLCLRGG